MIRMIPAVMLVDSNINPTIIIVKISVNKIKNKRLPPNKKIPRLLIFLIIFNFIPRNIPASRSLLYMIFSFVYTIFFFEYLL